MRKVFVFTYIFLFIPTVIFSNDFYLKNKKRHIGIYYSPTVVGEFYGFVDVATLFPFGISTSVGVEISDKILIRSGLSLKMQRITNEYNEVSESGGEILNVRETYKTDIIEVPLILQYDIYTWTKISLKFKSGFIGSFYHRIYSLEDFDPLFISTFENKSFNFIFNIGLGTHYILNEKLDIVIEPSIGYVLNGKMQEYAVLEIKTGIVYKF